MILPALLVDVVNPRLDLGHYLLEIVSQAVDAAPGLTNLVRNLLFTDLSDTVY